MAAFSDSSQEKLATCHPKLIELFNTIVLDYDCTVIQGYRSVSEQHKLFSDGKSKVKYGKHNEYPSHAVDVAPYIKGRGIPWPAPGSETYIKDLNQFYHFVGYAMATAKKLGISIRSGADWDRDHNIADQSFNDLPHFEIYTLN